MIASIQRQAHFDCPTEPAPMCAHCPNCDKSTVFSYCGAQRFPREAARRAGLPTTLHLWNCTRCHSTISHLELQRDLN
jgi:hypothetical protein